VLGSRSVRLGVFVRVVVTGRVCLIKSDWESAFSESAFSESAWDFVLN
jgi:hypothetical protein